MNLPRWQDVPPNRDYTSARKRASTLRLISPGNRVPQLRVTHLCVPFVVVCREIRNPTG
jgi:hypothetical protein